MPRINEKIRVKEVRLIDHEGNQLGIKPIEEAMQIALTNTLDLVEVSPGANPPVCKIMDFGKYKYELSKKNKENRKKQKAIATKEIKMRPKIDGHDFDTKLKQGKGFLADGHKVKVSVMFKGREIAYQDFGRKILIKFTELIKDFGIPEKELISEGRNLVSIYSPKPGISAELKKAAAAQAREIAETQADDDIDNEIDTEENTDNSTPKE
ncbi:MAG: translation initiation factor IF-3 [Candidatus Wallbacteria bacterium]